MKTINEITEAVIGAAIEVHRHLGPGLLESAYEECLCYEFSQARLPFRRQESLPVLYKGIRLDCGYRMDLVVGDAVIVEIKSAESINAIFLAQLLTYLRIARKQAGLLINFNVPLPKEGIKRVVNDYEDVPFSQRLSASAVKELAL